MRYLLTILIFITSNAFGLKYYVANSGNDSHDGQSPATAWKTITKINGYSMFLAGDSIMFNRGDSWNESMKFPTSGTSSQHIYIGTYGSGTNPIITGFQTVTGFTNVGNVWTTTVSTPVNGLNMVTINGNVAIKARYPNASYITFTSYIGDSILIAPSLTGTPDYTGKEIVVRTSHWVLDVRTVIYQHGDTLKVSHLTYTPNLDGNGFFFQNDTSFIDSTNEYSYDSTSNTLKVYSLTSPTVQISNIDTLVWLSKKNFIDIQNLSFLGANTATFMLDTCRGGSITNSSINYSGKEAIVGKSSPRYKIDNDTILNSFSNGIRIKADNPQTPTLSQSDSVVISNNYINKTGALAGMGGSGNTQYFAMWPVGKGDTILNNTVLNSGYIGIGHTGRMWYLYRNYVDTFCFVKDDGDGMGPGSGGYFPDKTDSGSIYRSNICLNGISAPAGTKNTAGFNIATPFYFDNNVDYVTVDSCTFGNGVFAQMMITEPCHDLTITHNLFFGTNGYTINVNGNKLQNYNLTFYGNVYYQYSTTLSILYYANSDLPQTIDNNYYMRPSAPTLYNYLGAGRYYTFPHLWQDSTGYDLHGGTTPINITSYLPTLYYNPTQRDSTIYITGLFFDAKSNPVNNVLVLHPFQSVLLFKANYELLETKFSIGTLRFN